MMSKKSSISLAGLGLVSAGATLTYLFRKRIYERTLHLPPAFYNVTVYHNVPISPVADVTLATDLYLPQAKRPLPTILIRTPYGRSGTTGGAMVFISQRLAERGYNVVCQDVRGRFDSTGGEFEPFVHEKEDGLATLDWIVRQPWSDGTAGMWGPSYLGYVQWAAAAAEFERGGRPILQAMMPLVAQADMVDQSGNGPNLDTVLRWMYIIDLLIDEKKSWLQRLSGVFHTNTQERVLAQGFNHLPISTADEAVLGRSVNFFRIWAEHFDQEDDPYLKSVNLKPYVPLVSPAVHLQGGWYDIFLSGMLEDFVSLQAAGKRPFLTIGGWHHFSFGDQLNSLNEALAWFDAHLKHQRQGLRDKPVRLYLMGADEWRDYDQWPPPHPLRSYYLQGSGSEKNGRLAPTGPLRHDFPDRYHYDPTDPTPNVGGPLLSPTAGPADNQALEARPDVLVFTSPPLTADLDIIGPVRARLYVRSSSEYTDFFARLCDVDENGRSLNVCDGLLRLRPGGGEVQADGTRCLEVPMSATAYRFFAGHRLRLQVSSGAHPRYGRNFGVPDPVLSCTRMVSAAQTLYHDSQHPSALFIPIAS
jgi:uncharacterized protein